MSIKKAIYKFGSQKKSIQKFKPIVLVELNKETFNNAGYDVKDVMCFFDEINYCSFSLFRGRKLPNNNLKEDIEFGNYLIYPNADRKNYFIAIQAIENCAYDVSISSTNLRITNL